MNLVLQNSENKFLARNKDNKLFATKSIKQALTFKDFVRANNTKKNLPFVIGTGWKAVNKDSLIVNNVSEVRVDYNDIEKAKDVMLELNEASKVYVNSKHKFNQIKSNVDHNRINELQNSINRCDLALGDIMHYIENNDSMDLYYCYKLIKLIRNVRKKRRLLKQNKAIADMMIKLEVDSLPSQKIVTDIDNIYGTSYKARVLDELFKNKGSIEQYLEEFKI